jgi:photosystem II stability/assembly factor-like uncharacterized protein
MYAGTRNSGVYKTVDAGASWSAINAGLEIAFPGIVTGLVVDPISPSILYVAIFQGVTPGTGVWVFKSTDGGSTWQAAVDGLPRGQGYVGPLAIDPKSPNILYVGTTKVFITGEIGDRCRLFKTHDAGAHWDLVGLDGICVDHIVVDPRAPTTLYVTTSSLGIFKSEDGGLSWRSVNSGLPNLYPTALAIDPNNSFTLYAGLDPYQSAPVSGVTTAVYKSIDGGASWFPANGGLGRPSVSALAVDPAAPSTVYMGAMVGPTDWGVYKSVDGGATWTQMNSGLSNPAILSLVIDPSSPANLYVGKDSGGVDRTTDGGVSWSATNLPASRISGLAIDPVSPTTLYAGTNGSSDYGVFKSTDGGKSWEATSLPASSVNKLVLDPASPSTLYAGVVGVMKSVDAGATWIPANAGLGGPTLNSVTALALDPLAPGTIYAGTSNVRGNGEPGIYRTTDGLSWTYLTSIGTSTRGFVADATSPGTIYAAGNSSTSWNGSTFYRIVGGQATSINQTLTYSDTITALASDPTQPGVLYAGISHYLAEPSGGVGPRFTYGVYVSQNRGDTWTSRGLARIPAPITTLLVHPTRPNTLYAGTSDHGVFRSSDGGRTWTALAPGSLNGSVGTLAFDPRTPSTLYAGTGAGLYRIHVLECPLTPSPTATAGPLTARLFLPLASGGTCAP